MLGFVDEDMYAPNAALNRAHFWLENETPPELYSFDLSTGVIEPQLPALNPVGGGDSAIGIDMAGLSAVVVDEERQVLYVAGVRYTSTTFCGCLVPVIVRVDLQTGEYSDVLTLSDEIGGFRSLVVESSNTLLAVDASEDRLYRI